MARDVGIVRRAPRTNAAPREPIGDIQRRRARAPDFNVDVGTPPEMGDENSMMQGIDMNDLVDLNPNSYAQEPALPGGTDPFYANLLGNKIPTELAKRVVTYLDQQFERDKQARENQDKIIARGIQETGYDRNDDVRSTPFPGASGVVHPLFAQASTDFSSRAMKQLFPSKGPIKTEVQGKQDEQAIKRSSKVKRFLNWLLTIRCRSYRGETDKLLTMLPFIGDAVKKLYWEETDGGFGRPNPEFVLPDKFIVPYAATDLEECPRYAHDLDLWPERVADLMDNKTWMKVVLPKTSTRTKSQQKERSDRVIGLTDTANLNDDTIVFREAHVDWYFPDLKPENDQFKLAAARKPAPAPQPQQVPGAVPGQPGAAPPSAAPGGAPAPSQQNGLDMVDLAGGLPGPGAAQQPGMPPKPETDPDAVPVAELTKEPGGDDQDRIDIPDQSGFPGGPKLPYVITYHLDSRTPVAIRRNWKKSDANQKKRVWFSHYVMFPWRSFNGLGLWHLIGGLARSATGTLRALMDSAVIDNMPGGVRLANNRVSGDDITYRPMEFAKIQAPGITDIRNVMMPYPKNPTSPVLFELLKVIVQWGQTFASTATQELVDNMTGNTPASAILQVLEQTAAIYSAVHARLHTAQEREFELLAELTRENLPDEGFAFSDAEGEETITAADFENVKISPVSDPDTFSEFQRSMRGQAMVDLAKAAKDAGVNVDIRYAFCFYAETLSLPDVDKLFPDAEKAVPRDPVSELFAVVRGQPVDAFPGQNHKAHVAFLKSVVMNPTYQQSVQLVLPNFLALVQSHVMFMLRDDMEQQAGGQLPLNQPLPPDQQYKVADACAVLMQKITQDALAKGPDPVLAYQLPTAQGAPAPAGPGGAAGAPDPAIEKARIAAEDKKIEVMRDKHIMDDQQKDNDQARKMAEKEAEIQHAERLAMFQDEMADKRNRREIAAKLLIHFTNIEHEDNMSAADRAAKLISEVNNVMDGVFGKMTERAHAATESSRQRQHELRGKVIDKTHEASEAALDRDHEREMSEQTAEQAAQTRDGGGTEAD